MGLRLINSRTSTERGRRGRGGGEEIGGVETEHGADALEGFGIILIYSNDSKIKHRTVFKKVLNTPEYTHKEPHTAAKQ